MSPFYFIMESQEDCKNIGVFSTMMIITNEASRFLQQLMKKRNKSGVRIGYDEKSS